MTPEDLNALRAIPDQLAFIAGPGGLPLIQVRNAHAQAQEITVGPSLRLAPRAVWGSRWAR